MLKDLLKLFWVCGYAGRIEIGYGMIRKLGPLVWQHPLVCVLSSGEHLCWKFLRQDFYSTGHLFEQGIADLVIKVDGSWDHSSKDAGFGCVVVDAEGTIRWIRAGWATSTSCASETEGCALLQGLLMAKEKDIRRAAFLIDSTDVFKVIAGGGGISSWCDSWMKTTLEVLETYSSWSIFLVHRDRIGEADFLATKARKCRWTWQREDCIPFIS